MILPTFATLSEYKKAQVTADQLKDAYLTDFLPSVKADYAQPLLDKMEQAKADYLNAFLDLDELQKHVKRVSGEAPEVIARCYPHDGLPSITFTSDTNPRSFLLANDLREVYIAAERQESSLSICVSHCVERQTEWDNK